MPILNRVVKIVKAPVLSRQRSKSRKDTKYLKLVSYGERIVIEPTDGKDIITQAVELFGMGIEMDLNNIDTEFEGEPARETVVQIFEMTKNGTLNQVLRSFEENLDNISLTQSQIISFVKNNEKWFRTGSCTMAFLFFVGESYCVVRVTWIDGEFYATIVNLANKSVWRSSNRVRFVIPERK